MESLDIFGAVITLLTLLGAGAYVWESFRADSTYEGRTEALLFVIFMYLVMMNHGQGLLSDKIDKVLVPQQEETQYDASSIVHNDVD